MLFSFIQYKVIGFKKDIYFYRDSGLELLADVSTKPAFKPWEVKDSTYRIQLDLALMETNAEAGIFFFSFKAQRKIINFSIVLLILTVGLYKYIVIKYL